MGNSKPPGGILSALAAGTWDWSGLVWWWRWAARGSLSWGLLIVVVAVPVMICGAGGEMDIPRVPVDLVISNAQVNEVE